ncbi:MAG: terpene cyclase/mutase family protein [Burkholderiales bacterium]|nr:terpene cyclase/mutase family protein [Burkholderiales bacterium]
MFANMKTLLMAAALAASFGAAHAAPADMNAQTRARAQQAIDAGLAFLRSKQAADGSVLASSGLTALSLSALLDNPAGAGRVDKAVIDKYAAFIASKANKDGSIVERAHDQSYNTAVSITALAATGDSKYAPLVAAGQKYIVSTQIGESRGFAPVDSWYGGVGYGGDERPDISNVYVALDALRATSYDPKDPIWKKALMFVDRQQNRSESNDQKWAGNDGGFAYSPGGINPSEDTTARIAQGASYASVTSAGMYSLLLIGVDKADPRVQAAYKWLTTNYTLDSNFGTNSKMTMFYYYRAFSKVMSAYGEREFVDARGQRHNWRNELADKLVSLQNPDGSWVNRDANAYWEDKPELATSWAVMALEQAMK